MAIAHVQTSSEINHPTTVGVDDFATLSVTAGSALVLVLAFLSHADITVSDDKGNTWTRVSQSIAASGAPFLQAAIYVALNCASGSTKVTVAGFGGTTLNAKVLEFSGVAATSAVDASDGNGAAGTSGVASVSGLTGTGNDLGVVAYTMDRDATPINLPSGWTDAVDSQNYIAWAWKIFTSSPSGEQGAITMANTWYDGAMVLLKPAAGGGTTTSDAPRRGGIRKFLLNH